ncbi:hypothetical protein BCR37DRAFT_158642 [Protomyces lactucae-debilis]|uniref:WSC domain-containing protein n=1 Tax=Protomyces lactucae-debilis TaxID=2754530 RepID=A0A1Y2EZF2_PROLT|nr:uncharacterized protein BCR37DRAFT_158642 [Protomyces lactucae-debilis]ORY77011.1 hypothetical protein BCR37DRAFT_158642 [Protomyces lactucae-debilis]
MARPSLLLLITTAHHLAMVGLIQAQATFICSDLNTGALSFSPIYAQFQSKGLCAGTCSGYAYAVLQGYNCWCSNYTPATTAETSSCDTGCPGFGTDNCGGQLTGAFAYYQLAQASGILGASSSSSQTPSSSTSSGGDGGGSSTSSERTTGNGATQQSTSSNGATRTVATATTPGQVTVFVTQTPGASTFTRSTTPGSSATSNRSSASAGSLADNVGSSGNSSNGSSKGFFDDTGKVAGTFVAVGLVALALIAALLWYLRKRSNQHRHSTATTSTGGAFVDRKASQSSSNTGNALMSQNGRSRSGSMAAALGEKNGRVTPRDGWPDEIIPVDQRLNPRPLLMRFDSNYSRHSLRDEEDYSRRVLTVTNPSED